MTEVVHLISAYKNFKMLTNTKPIQFTNGVAKVEFQTKEQANEFIQNIKDNPSLNAYCRGKVESAKENASGMKIGAQTSDIDKNILANQKASEIKSQNFYQKD